MNLKRFPPCWQLAQKLGASLKTVAYHGCLPSGLLSSGRNLGPEKAAGEAAFGIRWLPGPSFSSHLLGSCEVLDTIYFMSQLPQDLNISLPVRSKII